MTLENFLNYTEVDDDGDITVTAPKCDVSTMRRDADSCVYYDKGAGFFSDFVHLCTVHVATGDVSGLVGLWGLSNGAHTIQDKISANVGISQWFHIAAGPVYQLEINDQDTDQQDTYTAAADTTYYLTIERSGTALTCIIYSDAARQNELDTLEIVCATTTYQYIESIQSRDATPPDADSIMAYVEDLDLQLELSTPGELVFGEQDSTGGEIEVSWMTWSDGAGGSPTISGDADWGKLQLAVGAKGLSVVYDFESVSARFHTLTENEYGTGQGDATLYMRGQAATFNQDDANPSWEQYTGQVSKDWRFMQVKAEK